MRHADRADLSASTTVWSPQAWLFSGQRSDEIAHLRVGSARDAVCLLDVPTHKTGTAFTKPVDPLLGQALDTWQAVRPAQPKFTDRRTGEIVDLLFAFRALKVSTSYINNTVIPVLCRKAGVPLEVWRPPLW